MLRNGILIFIVVVIVIVVVIAIVVVIVVGAVVIIGVSGSSSFLSVYAALSRLNQPFVAESAPVAGMQATAESLIAEINQRVEHISTRKSMGVNEDVVCDDQYKTLLKRFSSCQGLGLDVVDQVCKHLVNSERWSPQQLAAFGACLKASAPTRLNQPGNRSVQVCPYLTWYLVQQDWDHICSPAITDSGAIAEVVAGRMYGWGMVCPDAKTLRIASAIVQTCSGKRCKEEDKRQYARDIQSTVKTMERDAEKNENIQKWPFEYILRYPRSPLELSVEILDHACGRGIRPCEPAPICDGNAFQITVQHTPCRIRPTSGSDPRRLDQTLAMVPTSPALPMAAASAHNPFAAMLAAMTNNLMTSFGQMQGKEEGIPITFAKGFGRQPSSGSIRSDASLAATEIDAVTAENDEGSEEDQLKTLEDAMVTAKAAVKRKRGTSESDPAPKRKPRPSRKAGAKAKAVAAAKRPAAATIAKRPAVAGPFDLKTWIATNITRESATPPRRNFVSKLHHRIYTDATRAGVSNARAISMRSEVRVAAGKVYDSVHK